MITLKRINNKIVKKIPIPNEDMRPVKGYSLIPEVYSNIFICAKKKSGKTSATFKILKECSIKNTVIIVFCSTIYKDKNWIQIRKYFENKNMDIRIFTSIYEDGEDQLNKLINELNQEAQDIEEHEEIKEHEENEVIDKTDDIILRLTNLYTNNNNNETIFNEPTTDKTKKPRKSKYQAPEYIIVLDDLSTELKATSLTSLMKKNRHFKTKIIISSQWYHDVAPESRKQIDVFILFKSLAEKKLEIIYKDSDTSLDYDLFYKIYKKATKKPFSFLFIDTRDDEFRRNFNEKFIINEPLEEEDDDEEK